MEGKFGDLGGLCVEVVVKTMIMVLVEHRDVEVGCSGFGMDGGSRCAFVVDRKIHWVGQK